MTDNGLAALAERLKPYQMPDPWTDDLRTVVMVGTAEEVAAAILDERAVFLPEGLAEEWDWRQERDALMGLIESGGATIAALRAALDGLVADFVDEDPDLPDDYPIEWEMTLGSLRSAALATAKETP